MGQNQHAEEVGVEARDTRPRWPARTPASGGPYATVDPPMIKTVIDAQRDLARLAPPIEAVVHEVTNPDPLIVMATAPDSERAAAFRVLRHRVASAGNPRVILVSSP